MRAGEGEPAVLPVAEQGQRRVLALAEPHPHVVDQHRVQRQQQLARRGVGQLAAERADPALHHQHDQAGAEAVAGHVADPHPAAVAATGMTS